MHLGFYSPSIGFASSVRTPPPILGDASLMKEFETTGEFWVPCTESSRFWGKLKFIPGDGVVLLLNGEFTEAHQGISIPTVNGVLVNGAPCTLLDCYCYVETFFSVDDRHFRSELTARRMILGVTCEGSSNLVLNAMSLRFSHLDDWFNNPLRIDYQGNDFEGVLLKWIPDSLDATVDVDQMPTRIFSFCARSIPIVATREGAKWTYAYRIHIQPQEPKALDWFLEIAESLRKFFIFLIGSGVYTLECTGLIGPSGGEVGDRPQILPIYIPVGMPAVVRQELKYFSTRHEAVRSVLPGIIRSWFLNRDKISVVVGAYAESLLTDGASRESIFLRTVQTLEHFHGILWPDEARYVPKTIWRRFLGWLRDNFPTSLSQVSPEDSERLNAIRGIVVSRISWLNDLSFRSRIERIFHEIPGRELMPILGNPPDLNFYLEGFMLRLEATRHYFTHFSEEQCSAAFARDELEGVTLQCWAALTFWLAHYLGFSDETAGDMALQASKAMFLVDHGMGL